MDTVCTIENVTNACPVVDWPSPHAGMRGWSPSLNPTQRDTACAMSQENVDLVRERYQQVNERGFAAIADILAPEFKMDSPQGVESSQAHDKAAQGEGASAERP
jgi:hypothetical protein